METKSLPPLPDLDQGEEFYICSNCDGVFRWRGGRIEMLGLHHGDGWVPADQPSNGNLTSADFFIDDRVRRVNQRAGDRPGG
ncbi:MAG TPA: hypothetical protein VND20_06200 [Candidatus Binataceae bacterium]|nr:hypothetical protein [Candidatus Binataceae bacterium]